MRYGIRTRILKLFHRYRTFQCCVSTVDLRGPLSCPLVRRNAHKLGGGPRSRTANVYHEGPDLQSGDAHALASRPPKTCYGTPGSSTGRLRASLAAALPIKNCFADRTLTDNILDTLNLAFLLERAFFTRLTTKYGSGCEDRTHLIID